MALLSTINKLTLSAILNEICAFIMIVVIFPHSTSLGASQLYMGAQISVISLIGLVWNPIIGSLGDSYGRKFILMRLLTIGAISTMLLLISNSLVIIFISRVIAGFAGPLLPIMNSLASEMLTKEDQEYYFGRAPTLMAVNMIVGSSIGGFISGLNNGPFLCFTLMLILNVLNIGVVSLMPDIKKETKKEEESLPVLQVAKREFKAVITKLNSVEWMTYSDIFSAKLLIEISCALLFHSIGPTCNDFGYHGGALGYVLIFMSVNSIVANIVIVKLKKRIYNEDTFGRKRLFHAAALFLVAAVVLGFSNGVMTYSLGMIFMCTAKTLADLTFTEALMAKASDEDRGGISGAFESIVSLCGLVIPVSAGILTDLYGIKLILKLSIIPTSVGLLLTRRDYNKHIKQN